MLRRGKYQSASRGPNRRLRSPKLGFGGGSEQPKQPAITLKAKTSPKTLQKPIKSPIDEIDGIDGFDPRREHRGASKSRTRGAALDLPGTGMPRTRGAALDLPRYGDRKSCPGPPRKKPSIPSISSSGSSGSKSCSRALKTGSRPSCARLGCLDVAPKVEKWGSYTSESAN